MSLDFSIMGRASLANHNITHNLGDMAEEAGIYYALWRPEEIGIKTTTEVLPLLEEGLDKLKSDPERFKKFNSPNGWGKYENFVEFVENVIASCKEYPDHEIEADR